MREYPLIQGPPESRIILRDFDAPINLAENYVQRLTSYLQENLIIANVFLHSPEIDCWAFDAL